ncbi:MAG: arginine repressor [Gemmatimonadetes bacterium]|nr:arginine repressor [Gemmatimonadota bacterium]NNM06896.1 arginine repressor [Gemmatimonadota bacterium]
MPRSNAAARRLVLRRLLEEPAARTQEELAAQLTEEGYPVTQATVSRDLAAIGAVREKGGSGEVVYGILATESVENDAGTRTLQRRLQTFVTGLDGSLNITVVQTQPSAAPTVASALDHASLDGVLGTVAGDDTVIIVTRDPGGGEALAHRLGQILKG